MYGYWNDWYSGWGWVLWFGVMVLLFSSIGNWGYTYRAHRRFSDFYPERAQSTTSMSATRRARSAERSYNRVKGEISESKLKRTTGKPPEAALVLWPSKLP